MSYFEVKIKCDRIQEDGSEKKVTESYLVDALTFTEAETFIVKEALSCSNGDFDVVSITKTKITELIDSNDAKADKWYKCKAIFLTIDERTSKEKKNSVYYLVLGNDLGTAKARLVEFMKGSCSDYELVKIEETPIMDVYKYE